MIPDENLEVLKEQVAVCQREYSQLLGMVRNLETEATELRCKLRKAEAIARRKQMPCSRKTSHKTARQLMLMSADIYNVQFRDSLYNCLAYASTTSEKGVALRTYLGLWAKKLSVTEILEFVFGLLVDIDRLSITTEMLAKLSSETALITTPQEAHEKLEKHRQILLSK